LKTERERLGEKLKQALIEKAEAEATNVFLKEQYETVKMQKEN